ncbi:MAG: hypothetical protein MHPSP_004636, partial [Paramarteilia canceri]
ISKTQIVEDHFIDQLRNVSISKMKYLRDANLKFKSIVEPSLETQSKQRDILQKAIENDIQNEAFKIYSCVKTVCQTQLQFNEIDSHHLLKHYYLKYLADFSRYFYEVCNTQQNQIEAIKFNEDMWQAYTGDQEKISVIDYFSTALNYSVYLKDVKKDVIEAKEFVEKMIKEIEDCKNEKGDNTDIEELKMLFEENLNFWAQIK